MTDRDPLLDMRIEAGEDDWNPTPHGVLLSEVLARHDLVKGKEVLELGGGVGNQTILLVHKGARRIITTEISVLRSATTRRNVELNCPDATIEIEYRVADWLNTDATVDLIISNPPFARSGRRNRRYFIDKLILDGFQRLTARGELLFVQSSMADIVKTRKRLDENGYDSVVVATTEGPFRDYYFEDENFMEEIKEVRDGYRIDKGTCIETLYVVHATLRPFVSPGGAH